MKLHAKYVSSSILMLLIAGCGSGVGPGATAVEMFKKVCANNDYFVMLEYVAPESAPLVSMGLNITKKDGDAKDQSMCKQEIKLVSEKITGDTALVTLANDNDPMNWKKIDGKWKFYVKK